MVMRGIVGFDVFAAEAVEAFHAYENSIGVVLSNKVSTGSLKHRTH